VGNDPIHGGAQRIVGGTGGLVGALASRLGETELRLGTQLIEVADTGDHVRLRIAAASGVEEIDARQLVLALPPRLAAASIGFTPPLPSALHEAMAQTPTWMASAAKAVVGQSTSDWRAAGLSGSAFVTHEQAVLAEVFDACDASGDLAALGGFLALSPDQRAAFAEGLPMLIDNQIAQLFGPGHEGGDLHYQDWASEPFTCTVADRIKQDREHPAVAATILRQAHWNGRLHIGGAETAEREPGYMEGALDAAKRVTSAVALAEIGRTALALPVNRAGVTRFAAWVDEQREAALAVYERRIAVRLARQERDRLTQLALVETVEAVFAAALDQLADITFDSRSVPVERGRSALTPLIQEPFRSLLDGLVQDVLRFNGGSCALSNFPAEHRPSPDYFQTIMRDIAAAWTDFSQRANALLLATSGTRGDAGDAR
jgi:monoamine oxidase